MWEGKVVTAQPRGFSPGTPVSSHTKNSFAS